MVSLITEWITDFHDSFGAHLDKYFQDLPESEINHLLVSIGFYNAVINLANKIFEKSYSFLTTDVEKCLDTATDSLF